MNRLIPIAVAALVAVAGGAWYMSQSGASNTPASLPMGANAQEAEEVDTSGVVEMVLGNEEASVEVIEYASYTCPHCASFHTGTYKDLKRDYIDTGKIKFTYREVYFDKYGMWASMVARCEPTKFFGITELIYAGQQDWARKGSDGEIADELRKIGRLAGIEDEKIEACLSDGENVRTLVAWFQKNVTEHGVNSTPSFVINGTTYKNMSYDDFKSRIDAELGN